MENIEQIAFFERLKNALPPNVNLALELSEILDLSIDSIYRRFRGESALGYAELLKIQNKLNLKQSVLFPIDSIDEINFVYSRPAYGDDISPFLEEISDQMSLAHRRSQLHVSLTSDDLPFFMHFLTPGLLQFKLKLFSNSAFRDDGNQEGPSEELQQIFDTILKRWLEADSDEVWGSRPLDSTLKQIEYSVGNRIISKNYAAFLFDEMEVLIDIINEWSSTGRKNAGDKPGGKIKLYHSELNVGEMNLLLKFGEEVSAYKSSYGYGYLKTENPNFCIETRAWIDKMENKGILISNSGEKYRVRYISMLRDSLKASAERIGI